MNILHNVKLPNGMIQLDTEIINHYTWPSELAQDCSFLNNFICGGRVSDSKGNNYEIVHVEGWCENMWYHMKVRSKLLP